MKNETVSVTAGLKKHQSPVGAWALGFGCSVGWGAFVMPGTTFLPVAGPIGTLIGLVIGALIMFVIGINYYYLTNRYPDAGGAYTYTKKIFGPDHGFLSAWFLIITYIAVLWANATALFIVVRTLFGNAFQFGFYYTIAGFDIYLGEVLVSVAAIAVCGLLCAFLKKVAVIAQTVFAFALVSGIVICFVLALINNGGAVSGIVPAFSRNGNPFVQIFSIAALSPWAFVGFESVSHSAEEFRFPVKKTIIIIIFALIAGVISYVVLSLLAVTTVPDGYADWTAYIKDLANLSGTAGVPTFNSAKTTTGTVGLAILGISVLAGIVTGLIANFVAASRLLYAEAKDGLVPGYLGKLDKDGNPRNAVLTIAAISLVVPFFGRTAISWIVDVTTIGATIAYAYVSLAAFKSAKNERKRGVMATGIAGFIASALFSVFFLIPDTGTISTISTESYLILVGWSIIGIIYFRFIIAKDKTKRIGRSSVVWIVLLILIFIISLLWMRSSAMTQMQSAVEDVSAKYQTTMGDLGVDPNDPRIDGAEDYLKSKIEGLNDKFLFESVVQMSIILISLAFILSIFSVVKQNEKEMEEQKITAEQNSAAKSRFLSNMSHDIRTPMNAITGYTALALKEENVSPEISAYLKKIDTSSKHLLALINDVLDMSRIESGKVVLQPETANIVRTFDKLRDMFVTQMEGKNIAYTVVAEVENKEVVYDEHRLMRILMNLVSNALKFTESGGTIAVTLRETGYHNGVADFEIRVKDSGIGMSEEFAERIFEAFEREDTDVVKKTEGTGLGMSITKSLVDMMNGSITVNSKSGVGTEFTVLLSFPIDRVAEEKDNKGELEEKPFDATDKKLLIVEDNPVNREIVCMILSREGFTFDVAENGKEAVDKVKQSAVGEYAAILMDVQMPVMNGYEATRAIRAMGGEYAAVPIIAMTANAFASDVKEAMDAGMTAHISKPIEIDKMLETLKKLIG